MKTHSATTTRNNFKKVLEECQEEPVYITKNGEVVGVLVDPDWWKYAMKQVQHIDQPINRAFKDFGKTLELLSKE